MKNNLFRTIDEVKALDDLRQRIDTMEVKITKQDYVSMDDYYKDAEELVIRTLQDNMDNMNANECYHYCELSKKVVSNGYTTAQNKQLVKTMMDVFERKYAQTIEDNQEVGIEDFKLIYDDEVYYGALGLRLYLEDMADLIEEAYNPSGNGQVKNLFDDAVCDYLNDKISGLLN